jgi:excinuclease ABC subunit C
MQFIPSSREGITDFLRDLPAHPGIYQFISKNGIPVYIGKAKNIKKRVSSYFRKTGNSEKVLSLIDEANSIELTLTNTELEALLLEQYLIKKTKPKYNVQFKDDKGYPSIKIETSNPYPSAKSFLGKKTDKETYFGPYPNSFAVKNTLSLIQKTFQLRNCSDSFFKNRTRPCLQHQIQRCSAPCVGLISQKDYLEDVTAASKLLEGKSEELIFDLYTEMDAFSKNQSYERAAVYRDKISALRDVQRSQSISGFTKERDALTMSTLNGVTKIGITHVNRGWITGHENFIQKSNGIEDSIMEAFIKRHYFSQPHCPQTLIIEEKILDKLAIERALSEHHCKQIKIVTKPGKKDKGLLQISKSNTIVATQKTSKNLRDISHVLSLLRDDLNLKKDIELIESYDISHHSGSGAVGGCVVYTNEGSLKEKYRLFNISKKNSGDDIASMKETIKRRFSSSKINLIKPNLILIDGGKVHLNSVKLALREMEINDIELLSISKGARRKSQMDSIHTADGRVIRVLKGSLSHLLLQEIRDETHRFAISSQKKKQSKLSMSSKLDNIEGVGESKKKLLLRYFGSVEQIQRASIPDLRNVFGIGPKMSVLIYNQLN